MNPDEILRRLAEDQIEAPFAKDVLRLLDRLEGEWKQVGWAWRDGIEDNESWPYQFDNLKERGDPEDMAVFCRQEQARTPQGPS